MKSWTLTLETDSETGDLVLPLTDEILSEVGWKLGEKLNWKDNKDGTWTLSKADDGTNENATE